MTDEAYTGEAHGLKSKLADLGAGAKDMAHAALKEAMAWSGYQWTVLALLTATFLLVALSYGGIRAELAALKEARGASATARRISSADLDKQMSDLKAGLTQSLTDMKTGLDASLAKINAKLDARSAPPKPPAPAPKAGGEAQAAIDRQCFRAKRCLRLRSHSRSSSTWLTRCSAGMVSISRVKSSIFPLRLAGHEPLAERGPPFEQALPTPRVAALFGGGTPAAISRRITVCAASPSSAPPLIRRSITAAPRASRRRSAAAALRRLATPWP